MRADNVIEHNAAIAMAHTMYPFTFGIVSALRANIDETVPPVIITEQGENRNQCEEQRNVFGFSHGFACC
jgi:hypothetical protein